jgi:hypothetical protein
MNATGLAQATALDFFARMNEQGIEYAVLRNYEQYPRFGHDIDLVVRWSHLPRWRQIAKACASDHAWGALTECDHWAQSSCREHTIQILRFYRQSSRDYSQIDYLQIDAFHAHLVNSLPLFDEDALLGERILDERGFYRIGERAENFFRLLQIARLASISGAHAKVETYRSRALAFWTEARDFSGYSAKLGFPCMTEAMRDLEAGDLLSYKRRVDSQKRAWWAAKMLAHPLRGSRMLLNRLVDYARLFYFRPCGFTILVSASAEQRALLDAALKQLADANLVPLYTLGGSRRQQRQSMERGGIAVTWDSEQRAALILNSDAREEDIMWKIVSMLIERHPRILDRREVVNGSSIEGRRASAEG